MSPFVFFFITSVIAAFAFADESPISEQNKGYELQQFDGDYNPWVVKKRSFQHILRNVVERMPGRYGGPMKALPRDVDEIEKRNYQYIWRNVAQKMPLYTQTSGFAEPMMITHPDKRSYQYIWRNVAERMPPKTRKFTKMVDYNGEDFYTF